MEPDRFFTLSLDLQCIISFDGLFKRINPAFEKTLGYSSSELVGIHFSEITHPDEVMAAGAEVAKLSQGVDVLSFQLQSRCKDGSFRYILWNATPFLDENEFYATGRDITRRIETEKHHRDAEERQRQILDAIQDMILCKGPASQIIWANRAFRDYYGMSNEELCKILDAPFTSHLHVEKYNKDDAYVFSTGKTLDIPEEPVTDCHGVTRLFHTVKSPIFDSAGNVVMCVAVCRDITARKQSEHNMIEAWRQAEESHCEIEAINNELEQAIQRANALAVAAEMESHSKSVMLSVIPSILIGIDEDEYVTEWNPAAQNAFGITPADVVGKPFGECGIQWDWPYILKNLEEHKRSAKSIALEETRFIRKDGVERVLGITFTPVLGGKDRWTGCVLLAADITQRKMLESQLAHAQKMESIGQLAAGIAHEINTPVQYIGDNTRFLQESFTDLQTLLDNYALLLDGCKNETISPEQIGEMEVVIEETDLDYLMLEIPRAIQQSLEGIERVAHIVQAMKEFSHPGVGEKTAIDINRSIDSTITVARNEWKYVAKMVTDFDPKLPLVPCLPGDFNQVILNIIVNAAHAIKDVVDANNGILGTITVSTRCVENWVEIRIQDTGTGIPMAIQGKVFDPFFTTKEVGRGTGQGLAIAHSIIVEKHGGIILLETEVGKGTTFIIRLPLPEPIQLMKAS